MPSRILIAFLVSLFIASTLNAAPQRLHHKLRKPRPACSNHRDDDHDGLKDYPADPGCKNRRDRSEKNRTNLSPTPTPQPGDGVTPPGGGAGLGAGASLGGVRAFPDDNPWNRDVSTDPIDPNSDNLIASIGLSTGLHPDFGTVYDGHPNGIPYVVVAGNQPKISISSFDYADESDVGPYPIPDDAPIEGGSNSDGDRHVIIVDRDNFILYELYSAFFSAGRWSAGSGAIFDLKTNTLRPAGWTSADAAGLPIFPGLVRYDEVVEQGEIKHALRFTVQRSRRAYVSPARHFASSNTDANLPPMGMRVRLKQSFDISRFPASVQVILVGLKKYGMFVADNGSNWFISGAPDPRWSDDDLATIRNVHGSDFEVVLMSGIITE